MNFIDLSAQYEKIRPNIQKAISEVLDSGQFIMGKEIERLESKLAEYVEIPYALSCASGTDAVLLALMLLDVGPGDEVITSAFSFIAAAEVTALLGAKPVFVDIEEDTYNFNPQLLKQKITAKTKAIIPVSLYGQMPDLEEIVNVASFSKIPVIEDGAQSFGATYKGKKSCAVTEISCTSFFPSKPLGCYGDGGALFFKDKAMFEKAKQLRVHGQAGRYYHTSVGINGRMDTLQAAILLEKLHIFAHEVKMREDIGARYSEKLSLCPHIKVPTIRSDRTSVFAQYTIRTEQRDELAKFLQQKNIPTAIHYPSPLPHQPCFKDLECYKEQKFPVSERMCREVLSLPMGPYLKREDQDKVVQAIFEFFG